MSFTILLQKNNSPMNKITKTLETIETLSGTLRNSSELVNPVIIIQNTGNVKLCNYLTISEFGRSYFITSIKSLRNNMFEIEAHCDVLSSFASEIKTNTAIVLRQENNFNLLLNDNVFKCKQNSRIQYKSFPSQLGDFNYILTVAGGH